MFSIGKHYYLWQALADGGWTCSGVNALSTNNLSEWGCLKPNNPRWDDTNQKSIKYEHPHGFPTELFCLRVTWAIGLKIAKTQGVETESEYLDRMGDNDLTTEDENFWQWVVDNPQLSIVITEGAKKAASLLSAGYLAIALPGIYGGYRSKINGVSCLPILIPQLEVFCQDTREISFCFDRDTNFKTVMAVNKAIDKTGKLLERKGCTVSVICWNEPHKGVDDLIFNLGVLAFEWAFTSRQSLGKWRLARDFDISPLPKISVDTRYLDAALPDSTEGKLIAIKSAKGTGKTEYIARLIAPELKRGRSVLVITHRIQLAKALATRLGINHLSEVRSSKTGSLLGYSLCFNSLHPKSQARFDPEAWQNAIVVFDECEQVFWDMLNSSTCQNTRAIILETFDRLLATVAKTNGTVILSDADLSKVSINYINAATDKQLELHLVENTYNPNQGKRKLHTYESPETFLAKVYSAIELGEKLILHCSSQKAKSQWSSQNLERAIATKFPDKRILRIDAETVADPNHPAYGCIDRINDIVTEYDVIIPSPTIETGISIDVKHFDSVWCLANGVQTVDAVCQTIERVRADVDRHICITGV